MILLLDLHEIWEPKSLKMGRAAISFCLLRPREKNNIAKTLVRSTESGELSTADLLNIPLGADVAVEAIAFESRLFALIDRYGIRGGRSTINKD
jgi:hypothetical protein